MNGRQHELDREIELPVLDREIRYLSVNIDVH